MPVKRVFCLSFWKVWVSNATIGVFFICLKTNKSQNSIPCPGEVDRKWSFLYPGSILPNINVVHVKLNEDTFHMARFLVGEVLILASLVKNWFGC